MIYAIKNGQKVIFPKGTKIFPTIEKLIITSTGAFTTERGMALWANSNEYTIQELLPRERLTVHLRLGEEIGIINVTHHPTGNHINLVNVTFVEKLAEERDEGKMKPSDYLKKIANMLKKGNTK